MKNILSELSGYRRNYLSKIAETKGKFEAIQESISLTEKDKENLTRHNLNEARQKVDEETSKLANKHIELQAEARGTYERRKRQDPAQVQAKAALLMPMLANMKDKEVLNVLRNQAGDRVAREVIGSYILTKASMAGDPTNHPLMYKFREIDRDTRDQLPQEEKEALEQLEEVERFAPYVNNALEEAYVSLQELEGNAENIDRVRLKQAQHILDGLGGKPPVVEQDKQKIQEELEQHQREQEHSELMIAQAREIKDRNAQQQSSASVKNR